MTSSSLLERIGRTSVFEIGPQTTAGRRLISGPLDVLLPNKWVTPEMSEGDRISVFLYTDSSDRPVATTLRPKAQVGDFACLTVVDQGKPGAFLDWGLDKDLLLPTSEMHHPVVKGEQVVVAVYLDNLTTRVAASSKIAQFLDEDLSELVEGQQVELLIYHRHARGYLAIIEDRWGGMLYFDQTFASLSVGQRTRAFVTALRPDGKVDLRLDASEPARNQRTQQATRLEDALKESGGLLPLGDRSPPEEIYERLGMSKKAFKAAAGALLKRGLIEISAREIRASAVRKPTTSEK